ncbi:MAG TPA: GDSL-type esterase/lipase family protein [Candidatus Binatia bacterium]|nr:GDSL-type esterase/lipase family protein [Candidatus Binatia bacterium]
MKRRGKFSVFTMVVVLAFASAQAIDRAGSSGEYLALGDSVVFGFIDQAGYEYFYPTNFVGYPDWTSLTLGLNTSNASCPGETTGSFLSSTAPDNGCHAYRRQFPLHVVYSSFLSPQISFATGFLRRHSDTALVTIMLGANDLFLLEQQCNDDPTCIEQGLPQVLAMAEANMQASLAALRATGYTGAIVVVNYYSLDYSNQFVTQVTMALNQAITAPAPAFGAVVADVFSAFQAAASNPFAGGNTCAAGLLNASNPPTSPPSCDVHPSQSGHKLIAQVVAAAGQSPHSRQGN